MKRITKYNIVNIVLIIVYITIILVQGATNVFLMNVKIFWFMAFLCFIGISLIFKFIIFKSDSSLWLGITLLCLAITLCILVYLKLNFKQYYIMFLISPIIGSLFVGLIFKDVLQLKLIVYIICLLVPIYLFNFNIINGYICVIIIVASYVVAILLFYFVPLIYERKFRE